MKYICTMESYNMCVCVCVCVCVNYVNSGIWLHNSTQKVPKNDWKGKMLPVWPSLHDEY